MSETQKNIGKSIYSTGGLLIILLIIVMVNLILSQVNLRWDLTEDHVYSLSSGSQKILDNLAHEVTIKVFYSKSVPNLPVNLKNYASRVLDFLKEYEHQGKGKIHIEVIDPRPDSEDEDWAEKYGIQGMDLPTGDKLYFGLVALSADQEETIKFLDMSKEDQLEYDITRIIARVQDPKKLKIGVLSSLPVFGQTTPEMMAMGPNARGQAPWFFITELKKTYDVVPIDAAAATIPDGINLLILMHPKDLSDQIQYAIDQYTLKGGNSIIMVDPLCLVDSQRGPSSSTLPKALSKAWGVSMATDKAVMDLNYATRLRNRNNQVEDNPMWLSLPPDAFNHHQMITGKLESMLLATAGAITKEPGSAATFEPLLTTSPEAQLIAAYKARMGVAAMHKGFAPGKKPLTLAARIQGTFKSAFPDGKPGESKDKKSPHLTQGEKPATLIIIADCDMLFDGYYVRHQNFLGFDMAQIFNDNLNFLLNASEMLTGSSELINIRSRGRFERPFIRVKALQEKAQARWLAQEQELMRKAEETNRKLRALENRKDNSQKVIVSPEQEAEIQRFQNEKIRINQDLKIVRRNLRSDIESLGRVLKFINIFLMPLLVIIAGILFALYRRRQSTTA